MNRIRLYLLGIFLPTVLLLSAPFATARETGEEAVKEAIVKIYTTVNIPDYYNPWRMFEAHNLRGSGAIISGHRILTNAHIVANQTFIQVRRHGQAKRCNAQVLSVSHEADLALLTVPDSSFFNDVVPLELGTLPATRQEVLVYGFPFGGDSLSITKGVISRIEHQFYDHSSGFFLAGQIDAAINPGNSGGPVVENDKIVGVVMQNSNPGESENIGYMVPAPIVDHFLTDMVDGRYNGFPDLGVETQKMENPSLKAKYGVPEEKTGVLVIHTHVGSTARDVIQKGDVITAVDGVPIADDGTVEFRPKERTHYYYYIDRHQIGDDIRLDILRKGNPLIFTLPLPHTLKYFLRVPMEQYDQLPRYFIFGGIVFSPLTKNLVKRWGENWDKDAPDDFLVEMSAWITPTKRESVVAIQVLAHDVNIGYHDVTSWLIDKVNGKSFIDFETFYRQVTASADPYIVLENKKGFQIILDRQQSLAEQADILSRYHIVKDHSADLDSVK